MVARVSRFIKAWVLGNYSILLLIAAWEGITEFRLIPVFFLPPLSSILAKIYEMLLNGQLVTHAGISLYRAFAGFVLGVLVAVPAGFLMGRYRFFEALFDPIVAFGYPMPKIAFIPVFIFWLGIGHLSKILTIFLGTFFPILINTYYGVKSIDHMLIWAALGMGANRGTIFRKVILPGAMPYIFVGMNISLGVSLLLVFTAEMVGAENGLGWLIIWGSQVFETEVVFAGILVIAFLGVLMNRFMIAIQSRVLEWNRSKTE
jgi:ABC-type nitrate/sulfonate/bicarbonate transport system permease component